jgi:hypothetical protein
MGEPDGTEQRSGDSALYREAAAELVDIHAQNPADARREYAHFVAALGKPTLAQLYLRSAAYASYGDHDEVHGVVAEITGAVTPCPPATSDFAACRD